MDGLLWYHPERLSDTHSLKQGVQRGGPIVYILSSPCLFTCASGHLTKNAIPPHILVLNAALGET